MKKILLLAAAATMAVSVSAQVFPAAPEMDGTDITPAGYKFNTYDKEFIGAPNINGTFNAAPWQLGNDWYKTYSSAEGFEFGDGLIGLSCPNYTGPQYKPENFDLFNAGCKIVDMGGNVGKVLVMNFAGSDFPEVFKKVTGNDLEIGEIPSGYTTANFWMNPDVIEPYSGISKDGEDYMPMRVRVELSIYSKNQASADGVWKAFMQNDQGNVVPFNKGDNEAADILVSPAEFAYRWCEKSDDPQDANDASTWDDGENGGNGEWNPNRWMVYEWDFNAPAIENEGDALTNIKLKNEIPGGGSAITVLVRSINVYVPNDEAREYVFKKRPRTWNIYEANAGVESVIATENAPVEYFNLQGLRVANPENGMYIMRQGNKVTKVVK